MPEEQIFVFIIDSMSSGDLKFIRKIKKFPFINFMTENGVIYENCYSILHNRVCHAIFFILSTFRL